MRPVHWELPKKNRWEKRKEPETCLRDVSIYTSDFKLPKIRSTPFHQDLLNGSTSFLGLFGAASSPEFRTHGPQGFKPLGPGPYSTFHELFGGFHQWWYPQVGGLYAKILI